MSLLSRLFGKNPPPKPSAEATPKPAPRVEAPRVEAPRVDTAAITREEDAHVAQAIASGDAAALSKWAVEGSSTRVRQKAAQAVTDPEQVRELMRAARGKDKNVYRILSAKRDEAAARERVAAQRREEVDGAATAVARHAERPVDATYEARLRQLEARWSGVEAEASAEQRQAVTEAIARARESLERHRQAMEAEAERQRAAVLAAEEDRRRRELEAQAAADAAAEASQLRQQEDEAARAKREADDAAVREMLGLLRQAQGALERGGTARATRLRDAIREKLPQSPALPAWYERKLQELEARIEELKDWKTFTVVPKRAELLQRMQSLVGADMAPEELARQVRRLRDEWRTLHRGAGNEPAAEDEPFEQAAAAAFEPCRQYFAEQTALRTRNAERREAVLARLAAFTSGLEEGPVNWRLVQQTLSEARREWRESAPVEPGVVKDLQARFHAAIDGLQRKLDAEYARNIDEKQAIVARAAELLTLPDTRQAIDEAKNLQRAWKEVGVVPRQQDDALWHAFREQCDAIFQRSSQEAAARDAVRNAGQARALELCAEVEAIGETSGDAFAAGHARLAALQAEFDALDLPRDAVRELRRRFGRALDRCDEVLQRQRSTAARQGWEAFFAAAAALQRHSRARAEGAAGPDAETIEADVVAALSAAEHAPKAARQALERAQARIAEDSVERDESANVAALRLLCVRAEAIAGVRSPPEDQELRQETQMRRLVEAMSGGDRSGSDLDALALEWAAVGPVRQDVYDGLLARFRRAWDAGAH